MLSSRQVEIITFYSVSMLFKAFYTYEAGTVGKRREIKVEMAHVVA